MQGNVYALSWGNVLAVLSFSVSRSGCWAVQLCVGSFSCNCVVAKFATYFLARQWLRARWEGRTRFVGSGQISGVVRRVRFLKKLWCCFGGEVRHKNLVLHKLLRVTFSPRLFLRVKVRLVVSLWESEDARNASFVMLFTKVMRLYSLCSRA